MEKLLTIIVPAYNAEETVHRCLSSLIIDWIEVIAVNDGSTDGTAKICEGFIQSHPDIFKLINKKNGGHGSAVNAGFAAASGKYVCVIDSDDYASEDLVKMQDALRRDADVLISDFARQNVQTGTLSQVRMDGKTPRICTLKSLKSPVTIHSLAVKRTLLNFKLTEGCYYDDIQFVLYSLARAVSFYYTRVSYYVYSIGSEHQSVSPENIFRRRADYLRVLGDIVDWYGKSHKCNDNYIFDYIADALVTNYNRYTSFITRDESVRQEIVDFDTLLKEKSPALYKAAGRKSKMGYVKRLRKRAFKRTRIYAAAFDFIKNIKGY